MKGNTVAQSIIDNGLCDVFVDDSLRFLKDVGVTIVETRAVWAMLEPRRGEWDFAQLDEAFEQCQRFGMKLGLFVWPQHPPEWFMADCPLARLRCMEHHEENRFLSFWEPRTPEILGDVYRKLATRYAKSAEVVYVGSAGCFGEPQYPQGVKHYHYFTEAHNHIGFWCDDDLARQEFRQSMLQRQGSLDGIARAWQMPLGKLEDVVPPNSPTSVHQWIDFAGWYKASLTRFVDRICAQAREAFPQTRLIMPVGTRGEPLFVGQDKWQIAKVASKYSMTCRWTGCGDWNDFSRSNVEARRISSAARMAGTDFGTEAALYTSVENGLNSVYEQLSNGAVVIHEDPGNYRRNEAFFRSNRRFYHGHQPHTRIAVFYSKLQQSFVQGSWDPVFLEQCAKLRHRCDFEILDEDMIADGGLAKIDLLISFGGWVLDGEASRAVRGWIARGGKLIEKAASEQRMHREFKTLGSACDVAPPLSFDSALDEALSKVEALPGISWMRMRSNTEGTFITVLDDRILCYNASASDVEVSIGERTVIVHAHQIVEISP